MSGFSDLANAIPEKWAPGFVETMRRDNKLIGSLNRDYEGEISGEGDTVRVQRFSELTGVDKAFSDAGVDLIQDEALVLNQVSVVANRRASASIKLSERDLIQSLVKDPSGEVIGRELRNAINNKITDYIYDNIVSPSASAPDHEVDGAGDFNVAKFAEIKQLARAARWPDSEPKFLMLDSAYEQDVIANTTLTSQDFVNMQPMVDGNIQGNYFGFNVMVDNKSFSTAEYGLAYVRDFCYLVMQKMPTIKVSDLHSAGEFGVRVTADLIYGVVLGHQGDIKHIRITS